ncbi:MAG: hydroxymethylglutaryl-CoA lyase [Flavobacteriales bacterium]|nr:hydroxymethylglutaryl-CoA lyase [Flavobacteriales bacterium]
MKESREVVDIIECPRDAMQGIREFIPTETKADYLNQLLTVGFDTLDFGSFVSPKAIPQMRDTREVLGKLNHANSNTKLLAIVGNLRGAEEAAGLEEVDVLGFPFSVSETFLKRNLNTTIEQALESVFQMHNLCEVNGKELVVYISMAFGNPYNDMWDPDIVCHYIDRMVQEEVDIISLADTVGEAGPDTIKELFSVLIEDFPETTFGGHFHARPDAWEAKVEAAFSAGCRRFDGAIRGFGGCPMAKDELVGNIATEHLLDFMDDRDCDTGVNREAFDHALIKAADVFMG